VNAVLRESGLRRGGAKFASALIAWANLAKVAVAVNSGGVAIREFELQRVIPHRARAFRGDSRLEHWQHRGRHPIFGFFLALIVAHRAGAGFAEVRKRVAALVPVRPRHREPFPGGHHHLYRGGLFARIERNWHG
jgi:hypothetical protein